MVKDKISKSVKKSNRNYSNQAKVFHKLKKLRKFNVDGMFVLDQILTKLENKNANLSNGDLFTQEQSFDAIITECEKLKTLAFLFSSSTFNEESGYDSEFKSGASALLKSIAENIEKFLIIFANKAKIAEVKI